jgi:hypothetical protein
MGSAQLPLNGILCRKKVSTTTSLAAVNHHYWDLEVRLI